MYVYKVHVGETDVTSSGICHLPQYGIILLRIIATTDNGKTWNKIHWYRYFKALDTIGKYSK